MKEPFTKPALELDNQIANLEDRGMIFNDKAQARFHLGHLNYYRLRAYWIVFESDLKTHTYKKPQH